MVVLALAASCSWADTPINSTVFPDDNFREVVRNIDPNNDSILTDSEIAAVSAIYASGLGISSLKGIEVFTALKSLTCPNNTITALDLTSNTQLETLVCDNNQLTSLNLSACDKLKTIFCTGNKLTALDLSRCPQLQELYCYVNSLDVLNLTNNTALVSLDCQENRLSAIDLSWNNALEYLDVGGNNLTSLNLSKNPAVKYLVCRDLNLAANGLDVSSLPDLRTFDGWYTTIDLSGQDSLSELLCYGNNITSPVRVSTFLKGGDFFADVAKTENVSDVTALDASGKPVRFLGFDAANMFSSAPALVRYSYNTGLDNVKLNVTSQTAAALKTLASCSNGVFEGTSDGNILMWKGIPYAKQPVGSLRWKAPEAPDDSNSVSTAHTFAPAPIQHASTHNPIDVMPRGEECLALNVWNNTASDTLKPVMVWVHGGAFNSGGTSNPDYDGRKFIEAHNDVILVSVGYRVGMMGFIDFANSGLPGGKDYPDSGNLGLLDILQSLRWVKQNIKAFGGDPENITVFGQSSGSASIALIMAMPEAAGVFQKAIAQSGAVSMTQSVADSAALTQALVKITGAKSMADLLALSSNDLMAAAERLQALTNFPERDGIHVAADPFAALAANSRNFSIMTGTMADELNYWMLATGAEEFAQFVPYAFYQIVNGISAVNSDDGKIPEQFVADYMSTYDDATELEAMSQFLNDLLFRVPAVAEVENYAGKKYLYYWEHKAGIPLLGACHALDIAYVLNMPEMLSFPKVVVPFVFSQSLANKVQAMWVNFAKTGNPSESWPEYGAATRATMLINDSPSPSYGLLAGRSAMVSPLLKYGISGRELINGIAGQPDLDTPIISPDTSAPAGPDIPTPTSPDISETVSEDILGHSNGKGGCNAGFPFTVLLAGIYFLKKRA